MTARKWAGRVVTTARAHWAPRLPLPCWRCGRVLTRDSNWTVGHLVDRALGGDLTALTNQWPECAKCNYRAGGKRGAAITNARQTTTRPGAMAPPRDRGIRGI